MSKPRRVTPFVPSAHFSVKIVKLASENLLSSFFNYFVMLGRWFVNNGDDCSCLVYGWIVDRAYLDHFRLFTFDFGNNRDGAGSF